MENPSDPNYGEDLEKNDQAPMDSDHDNVRDMLRVLGPVGVGIGLIFALVGLGSFFSSFGSFQPPRYFWCAFIGLPFIALGSAICKFAFMGAVSRYIADEVAPVGKDVVNYMADGTHDALRQAATAVSEGIRTGLSAAETSEIPCPECKTPNEPSAKFCKGCGKPLGKTRRCAACGQLNDSDARFCDHCGKAIA